MRGNFLELRFSTENFVTEGPQGADDSRTRIFQEDEISIEDLFDKIYQMETNDIIRHLTTLANEPMDRIFNDELQNAINDKDTFKEYVLDTPMTTLLFSTMGNEENNIPILNLQCSDCGQGFNNHSDYINHMATHQHECTEEELNGFYDTKNILTNCVGINIETCGILQEIDDTRLIQWNCTYPGCHKCGHDISEYMRHREQEHEDDLSKIHPLIGDIIRFMRKNEGLIPKVKDFFPTKYVAFIRAYFDAENPETYVFLEREKYEVSLQQLVAEEVEHDTLSGASPIDVTLVNDGQFIQLIQANTEQEINEGILVEDEPATAPITFMDYRENFFLTPNTEETSIEGGEDNRIVITNDNLEAFTTEITDMMKNVHIKEDINPIRQKLMNTRFDDGLLEVLTSEMNENSEEPILFSYVARIKWLPQPGYGSPFNDTVYKDTKGLSNHINNYTTWAITNKEDGKEKHSFDTQTAYMFPITGEGRWRIKRRTEDIPDLHKAPYICKYIDCDYITTGKPPSLHYRSGIHTEDNLKYESLGPFWGPQCRYVNNNNRLAPCAIIYRNRKAYKCCVEECHTYFGRKADCNNHISSSKHHIRQQRSDFEECEVVWVTREEEEHFKEELLREQRRANARPVVENPIQTHTPTQQQTVTHREERNQSNQNAQQAPPLGETRSQQQETEEEQERMDELTDNRQEIPNEHLIAQAQEWINEYKNTEEQTIGIPTMTKFRRKRIKSGLKALYTTTIIPLLHRFMPTDNSEGECTKLDGIVYRVSHILREHCRERLNITKEKVYKRGNTVNENRRIATERAREEASTIAALSLSRDSMVVMKSLCEMREIMKSGDENEQVNINRMNNLCLRILSIINLREDEWCNNIFGGKSENNIRETLQLGEQQFENRLQFLRTSIDTTATQIKNKAERIRELYEDNARKCLNHYVWPKLTPECQLTAENFLEHYGSAWSEGTIGYLNPLDNDDWNIDKTIIQGEGENSVDNRLLKHMLNPEKILKIIKSKNYISAHGNDGLSNALFKLLPDESAKMFQLIFNAIAITKHVPMSWRNTKTIMLYKKGDPSEPKNWRPIGITSTMYRIFTGMLSSFILEENKRNRVFHRTQKGFIGGGNGAHDNIAAISEAIYHAKRNSDQCIVIGIDLTNAFGSVPHQLIFDSLNRKGFGELFISIVASIYDCNKTQIEVKGHKSEGIMINKGVVQGCPLSPLLFNACIDPLLTNIERFNSEDGIQYQFGTSDVHSLVAQGYADDIVLIAKDAASANRIISKVEEYCRITGMQIAANKCTCMARKSLLNDQDEIRINGTIIPIRGIDETITYLGAPITGSKISKHVFVNNKIEEVKNKIRLVFNSQLTLSQKIGATKTYVLPQLDYIITNAKCRTKDLEKLNSFIRGLINKELNGATLPAEFTQIAARYGGLGVPDLKEKADTMNIINESQMILSDDQAIKALALLSIEEEKTVRGIVHADNTEEQPTHFLDWAINEETHEIVQHSPTRGTNCAIINCFNACRAQGIDFHIDKGKIEVIVQDEEESQSYKSDDAKCIRNFLKNQKQRQLVNKITKNRTQGHSFTGKIVPESNPYRENDTMNDRLFKFMIRGRTNTLFTPANAYIQGRCDNPECKLCHNESCTLNHTLNSCPSLFNKITWRHNLLVCTLKHHIMKEFSPDLYKESCTIDTRELLNDREVRQISDEEADKRPDIQYVMREEGKIVIIEVTCPYNQETTRDENGNTSPTLLNTLEVRQNEKEQKYQSLTREVKECTGFKVEYYTVVVSSLGHITERTKKNIIKLFGKKKAKKILTKLAIQAILGSACIYNNCDPHMLGSCTPIKFPRSGSDTEQIENEDNTNIEEITEQVSQSNNSTQHETASSTNNENRDSNNL